MEKLLILSLSFLLASGFCSCQVKPLHLEKCNCDNKKVQDSLISIYIDNGALKRDYNRPQWQLYCDSLINICPNIAVAYQLKAIPFIKYGDYATAFPLEDKAVELKPEYYTAYRGFLKCIFTKDYHGAITDFEKAQQLTPNNYEMDHTYFFYEGLCNLELQNYSRAEENFKRDIFLQTGGNTDKENTAHFNSLLYMGILYFEMKEDKKAKEYLQKSLNIYKQLPEANYYLALVYKRENNSVLKNKYLQIAKESILNHFGLNEDNIYYANYPHHITLYEINRELKKQDL